ncbi:hypothetical protein AURDEDRAFT_160776 [Auricularia subglabra TFB-10046 SS5]|nr:hypothetical protein AURDEDRAFT_160776 [Auricularia subglabra TFB-10046 SS5]
MQTDLIPIFDAWDPDRRLIDVHLSLSSAACSDLTPILHGALHITIDEDPCNGSVALRTGGITLILHPTSAEGASCTLGPLIARSHACFSQLESLVLPLDTFNTFARCAFPQPGAALPALLKLDIRWRYQNSDSTRDPLSLIPQHRPMYPSAALRLEIAVREMAPPFPGEHTTCRSVSSEAYEYLRHIFPEMEVRIEPQLSREIAHAQVDVGGLWHPSRTPPLSDVLGKIGVRNGLQ